MKKMIALCLIVLMCFAVFTPVIADVDISNLSEEELLDLQARINARLKEKSGDSNIIYDSKTAKIQWIGVISNGSRNIQNSMIITNNTENLLYFEISKVAYNGFQFTMANSGICREAIEPGMSYLTSSAYLFLITKADIEAVGIKDASEITDVFFEIRFYTNREWNAEPIDTEKIRLSIP